MKDEVELLLLALCEEEAVGRKYVAFAFKVSCLVDGSSIANWSFSVSSIGFNASFTGIRPAFLLFVLSFRRGFSSCSMLMILIKYS